MCISRHDKRQKRLKKIKINKNLCIVYFPVFVSQYRKAENVTLSLCYTITFHCFISYPHFIDTSFVYMLHHSFHIISFKFFFAVCPLRSANDISISKKTTKFIYDQWQNILTIYCFCTSLMSHKKNDN